MIREPHMLALGIVVMACILASHISEQDSRAQPRSARGTRLRQRVEPNVGDSVTSSVPVPRPSPGVDTGSFSRLSRTVETSAISIARVQIAEARWLATRDHDIIAGVLTRYAEQHDVSVATAAQRLVWRFSRPPAWVRRLQAGCWEPPGWSDRWAWGAHRAACLAVVERAQLFLDGHSSDPCPRAEGWRTPGPALAKALKHGWVREDCGRTVLAFVRRA